MLCKKATKESYKEALKKRIAGHCRLDFWNVNISFNLGQSQSNTPVANPKIKSLDVTLDDQAGIADKSW